MKVLVTGAKGFVGTNLCAFLKNIGDGKDRRQRYRSLLPLAVYEYDRGCSAGDLDAWTTDCDFVFHLAGANRPADVSGFVEDNVNFTSALLEALGRHGNTCPVMFASSIQASLEGRFAQSAYGRSKLAAEELVREYGERTGAKVLIYRFPNIYGKWCRPHYNSAVATFCHQMAHNLPIAVDDPATELELLYIDDLAEELLEALLGNENRRSDGYCQALPTDLVTLGEVVSLLQECKAARETVAVPDGTAGSFAKKLHATYLSYLSPEEFSYPLTKASDERGAFVEFLRTPDRGQVSVNVIKPGYTKGQHWHHTKWEKFLLVSGEALIQCRRVGVDGDGNPYPVASYRVCGDEPVVVEVPPGYAHSITNVRTDCDAVVVMWANEPFDPARPDTYEEVVAK